MELTEKWLAEIAGWEVMKQARRLHSEGRVVKAAWQPPRLEGSVQAAGTTFQAGLIIQGERDVENICRCRAARAWGTMCAHSIALGLEVLLGPPAPAPPLNAQTDPPTRSPHAPDAATAPAASARLLDRALDDLKAELLQVHVIFPPNLGDSPARGRLVICLEAEVGGQRRPWTGLPKDRAYRVGPEDDAILAGLESLVGGERAPAWTLTTAQVAQWLPALIGHPRLTMGRNKPLRVSDEPWAPSMTGRLEPNGELLLSAKNWRHEAVPWAEGWVFRSEGWMHPLGLPASCAGVLEGPVRLTRRDVPGFIQRDYPALVAGCGLELDFDIERIEVVSVPPEFHLRLRGGMAVLRATLECRYGTRSFELGRTAISADLSDLFFADTGNPLSYVARDPSAENAARQVMVRAGFEGPSRDGEWKLEGQDSVLEFLARVYPSWRRTWHVELDESLSDRAGRNVLRVEPTAEITGSGQDWFELTVAYRDAGGNRVGADEIQRLLRSGRGHVRMPNGQFLVCDTDAVAEFQEVIRDADPRQTGGGYRLNKAQAGFIQATVSDLGWHWRGDALEGGDSSSGPPPLGPWEAILRPYQQRGVLWMHTLAARCFGGILADEMGLGKTPQTLAYLWGRRELMRRQGERRPALVVCPTSLVFHWAAEAGRFVPDFRLCLLHGADRSRRFGDVEASDLVVTSYAQLRRDADTYSTWSFDSAILDEAQHIKNRLTQNAQVVKGIHARHRFALTGTPLENSVQDLWSLFDFLMPGYLGAARDFRERYETPLMGEPSAQIQSRLARRVRPFLLRRLKREVAPELPAKLEQIAWCDLSETQSALYRQVLQSGWQAISESVRRQGLGASRTLIFNTLLRLRQICCDVRLLNLPDLPEPEPSGKMDLFSELLEEILDGSHRVLVFSQFVSMLELLRERLEAQSVPYCYLDGSTRHRAAVVGQFQQTRSIPVFLISLKAGGTGLNLTGADTVVHFDPWWNPAVEAQATDRAHRIGQTQVVTSYKLIARGTVEEKILKLQARKHAVIGALVDGSAGLPEALTWDDIEELMS